MHLYTSLVPFVPLCNETCFCEEAAAEADQSLEAEATEAAKETTDVTDEATETTEETTEATIKEKAEPVEEEQVDMIDIEEPAQDEDSNHAK